MADRRLEIRGDTLLLLMGPSGSGKTTFANRCFQPGDIVSSDVLRLLVAGDEHDQTATPTAFRLLHLAAHARLRRGRLTVIDATNVLHASRRSLLRIAERYGRPALALAFALPLGVCLEWNAQRPGRSIPAAVLRRQHALMERSLGHLPAEGFDDVVILRTPDEVSGLEIVHRST